MTALTATQSVRSRVLELSETLTGPRDVSFALLASLTDDELRAALAEVLPGYCTQVLVSQRRQVLTVPPPKATGTSAKIQAIKSWYSHFLSAQLPTASGWKRLGECGAEDLLFASHLRHKQAAALLHSAQELEALVLAMAAQGVTKLSELSEIDIRAALASVHPHLSSVKA